MMKYKRPIFRRIGSKYRALEKIIPTISTYVTKGTKFIDAFCGTGVVSLNIPAVRYHIVNDVNDTIIQFFRAYRDDYDNLYDACKSLHPSSRSEFYDCRDGWFLEKDHYLRLAKWYLTVACSYLGRQDVWAVNYSNQQPGLTSYLNLWPALRSKISTWQLECLDWRNRSQQATLLKYDDERTVWYFDPPYVETEGMSWREEDLSTLLDFCNHADGCVMLSHYPLAQIDQEVDWDDKITYTIYGSASTIDGERKDIIENLWIRF